MTFRMTTGQPSAESARLFRKKLLAWAAAHPRSLPWKGESDPYKIWLSEIILQQTRVEQGLPYYERFVARFPTVQDLAAAPEDEVLKLWEGLGYYTRARNLHAAARHVADELKGVFPTDYAGLRTLKGVGDYTAAAIASFAFRLPHAVVDGNVFRVLARVFGIATPTDSPAGKKEFAALAQALLDPERPGEFNQAIMDFGATHCLPRQPRCGQCPFADHCEALAGGRVAELPAKGKALARKERFFIYLVFRTGKETLIRRRAGKDVWQNLWEFPLVELHALPTGRAEVEAAIDRFFAPRGRPEPVRLEGFSLPFRQTLTHRQIAAVFCEIDLPESFQSLVVQQLESSDYQWILFQKLKKKVALPRIIDWYLREKTVTYSLF